MLGSQKHLFTRGRLREVELSEIDLLGKLGPDLVAFGVVVWKVWPVLSRGFAVRKASEQEVPESCIAAVNGQHGQCISYSLRVPLREA